MHLRIRTKFIGILAVAAVLPLCIALITAQVLGYRAYRKAQGELFQLLAEHLAQTLSWSFGQQIRALDEWAARDARLHERLAAAGSAPRLPAAELRALIREFQNDHPSFASLVVADPAGRTVSARGDAPEREPWVSAALALGPRRVQVEGINFDKGTRRHAVEVIMAVRAPHPPAEPVPPALGAIKAVLDAGELLRALKPVMSNDPDVRQVVLGGGTVPMRLFPDKAAPLDEQLSAEALEPITARQSGWMLASVRGPERDLVGFARVETGASAGGGTSPPVVSGSPMHVIVYHAAPAVLAPVRRQLWMLGTAGFLLVVGFVFAGYRIAGHEIIRPIETLRSAAHGVAASAKLDESPDGAADPPPPSQPQQQMLAEIDRIRTGDELEELSHEFGYMASRVLSYHSQLESEIAMKTAEMRGDLQMARDFQQALMPHHYPPVPTEPRVGSLRLAFHHVYEPASTVGGDFFDVLKLDDTCAGIFIADVMGHGTRSALVTAILRTLLQDFAHEIREPAALLRTINRHFHDIVRQSNELIFGSAFYLVIDTGNATISYASAGHPSPLLGERNRSSKVAPLLSELRDNPALGVFPDSNYQQWTKTITDGDVFLLFTDGVYEAANLEGEEFGQARLHRALAAHLRQPVSEIPAAIVRDVTAFLGGATLADDLCLVAVEVATTPRVQPARLRQAAEEAS